MARTTIARPPNRPRYVRVGGSPDLVARELEAMAMDNILTIEAAEGSMFYWTTPNEIGTLAAGTTGQILRYVSDGTTGYVPDTSTFTIPDTFAAGDLVYASAANTLAGLTVGSAGQVLGITAGLPAWRTASTYLAHTVLDAAYHTDTLVGTVAFGDIIRGAYNGGTPKWTRLAAGAVGALLMTNAASDTAVTDPDWATTLTGNYTLSAAGTALAVTNNATIGGTLGVTGNLTTAIANTRVVYSASGVLTGSANLTTDGSTLTLAFAGNALNISNAAGTMILKGWSNTGTTTLATAQGDGAWGLTGAAQTWYDQSAATHYWYNASGTVSNQISSVASTNTQFNLTNLDIDFIIRSVNNNNIFYVDAGVDGLGIGTTALSDRLINANRTITATSGTQYGYVQGIRASPAADNPGSVLGAYFASDVNVAFNIGTLVGNRAEVGTLAGFSAGTITTAAGFQSRLATHAGAGAITTFAAFQATVPSFGGSAGTVSTYAAFLANDWSTGTVTNRIAFWQLGTNMHSRFQGTTTFGANAPPTNSATVDIQGSLGVGAHGTTLATSDFCAGSGTSSKLFYDDSLLVLQGHGTGATKFWQLSSVAGTENVFNETGADIDSRFESDTDANCLFVDGGNNNVGIGTGTPSSGYKLEVNGKIRTQDVVDFNYAGTAADTNVPIMINTPTGVAALQNSWLKIELNGVTSYVPVWQ